ncbi:hypothetical protein EKK58_09175 [Candidatus Dependentiae bacterium]|nr:MAG: hypothetical protein EKK58_09175 [Candidatus Dependentiae bacterium]
MKAVMTPHTNAVYGKPKGWDDSKGMKCTELPVCVAQGIIFSWWKPTFKERIKLAFGVKIRLAIVGGVHPPVAVDATNK